MNWLSEVAQHTASLSIRSLIDGYAKGAIPYDFTVGDWDTQYFAFPSALREAIARYYAAGATNYADIAGEAVLRDQIAKMWSAYSGFHYSSSQAIVVGGTRSLLYLACRTILNAGDLAMYSVPNWNTKHYLRGVTENIIEVDAKADSGFLLQPSQLEPYRNKLNLLLLNVPLNPSGYCYDLASWETLLTAIEVINEEREAARRKPLFVVVDAIYHCLNPAAQPLWQQLAKHPKLRDYFLFIDGIAKCYVATGVRVGWAVGPEFWIGAMVRYNGYLGSWAAKPEQLAVAEYLESAGATDYIEELVIQLKERAAHWGTTIKELQKMGYPVDMLPYQGGLYLSIHLPLEGYRGKFGSNIDTTIIDSADTLFHYLVKTAGIAIVSFKYLDAPKQQWWFRVALGRGSAERYKMAANALKEAISRLQK